MLSSQQETLIKIPNSLLQSIEVQAFMRFLEKNTKTTDVPKGKNIRDQFEYLFQTWKSETALCSSASMILKHHAYQKIINLGETILPFILIKLQNDPQHLFFALYQITGENPVPLAHAGHLEKMTKDWLSWGVEKGYLS